MVKIFTMVKDEVDIIDDWLKYHGSLFGYENLYIIDNYSTDGTYEILQKYSNIIYVRREYNYKKKGKYMKNLIKKYCKNEIAFPIDIDEFIVLYENNNIIVNKDIINNYINNLPKHSIYKCNYIYSIITGDNPNGYDRAIVECKNGIYQNLENYSKSFINPNLFDGEIDHGNHIPSDKYFLTDICLVHYHCRNLNQMKQKVLNNILGLGYKNDINLLKEELNINNNCAGNHHVKNQINILENNYTLQIFPVEGNYINLSLLGERMIQN
jgi:hypothetical protein